VPSGVEEDTASGAERKRDVRASSLCYLPQGADGIRSL